MKSVGPACYVLLSLPLLLFRPVDSCDSDVNILQLKKYFPNSTQFFDLMDENGVIFELLNRIKVIGGNYTLEYPTGSYATIFTPSNDVMSASSWIFNQTQSMRIQLINTHVVYHSEPEMKLIQPYRTANPSDTLRIMVDHYPSINVRTNTTDATIISVGESEMCALGIHVIDTLLVPTQFFNSNNIPEQLSQLQQELSGNYGNNDSLPMVQVREYKAGPETGGNMVDLDMNRNLYAYISLLQNLGLMQYLTQVPTPVTILAYRSATVDEIYQISSELDQDDKQGIQKRIIQATVLPNVREVLEGGMYLSVGEDVIQFSTEDGNRTKVSVYPYQRDQNTQQVLQTRPRYNIDIKKKRKIRIKSQKK
eukprot:TRINITY_DN22990_c0_g1_i2.p1 TRINITY_DN22990_c0_g1~~TRINITY_DN22990_c0_g1_i2.p1  ORF type:complete len:365 (-),score=18.92 TRINITY_DN22990_c0_g1_i2:32-1126(-)